MTTFRTMNPAPSAAPKDLFDNSENFDLLLLGTADSYEDRLGTPRKSWAGMETDFSAFLESSGYEIPVPYAAGILMTRPTQVLSYLGELYRAKNSALPFTTTTFAADSSKLVAMGDFSLRQFLASSSGAGGVGFDPAATYPAGSVGDVLQQFADQGYISVRKFGAIAGGVGNGITNINAINAAFAAASIIGAASQSQVPVILPRSSAGAYEVGGVLLGTNKVMCPPLPWVDFIIQGKIKIADGQNTLAGTTGYKFIGKAENTDAETSYFTVHGQPGNYIDGNAANNLNLIMKSNALIAVLKGVGCGVDGVNFQNCPGYHVIQWGLNTFPFSIGPVFVNNCTFTDVGETIAGNTGITDHSSVYGFTTIYASNNKARNNGSQATICALFEAHGDNSVIEDNDLFNYYTMVNIGGYASNARNLRISYNKCGNCHILVRCFTLPGFEVRGVQVNGNYFVTGVGTGAMADFGVATAVPSVYDVRHYGNHYEFNGADHGVSYPPAIWIANVNGWKSFGNTYKGMLGPVATFGNLPTGSIIEFENETIINPNSSAYAASYAAFYLDNVSGKFKLFSVKNCSITGGKAFGLATTPFNVIQGGTLEWINNSTPDLPNTISVESISAIDRVVIDHKGPAPLSAFEVGNQWAKVTVGSRWHCTDTGVIMEKTVAGSTYWNKTAWGTGFPVAGNWQRGDRVRSSAPAAGGFSEFICVLAGSPGTWKTANVVSA